MKTEGRDSRCRCEVEEEELWRESKPPFSSHAQKIIWAIMGTKYRETDIIRIIYTQRVGGTKVALPRQP